jgi:hypothetical protein
MKKTAMLTVLLITLVFSMLSASVLALVEYVEGFNDSSLVTRGHYYSPEGAWYGIRYVPTISYNLRKVELVAGRGNGLFIIQLRPDNGTGWPSSTVLRQTSFAMVDSRSWQGAEFPSSHYVTAGTTYWIAFKPVYQSYESTKSSGTPINYARDSDGDGEWDYKGYLDWKIKFYREVPPPVYTALDFWFTPDTVKPGETVELQGTLMDEDDNPVYPAQVEVEYSTDGGGTWHDGGTLDTNATGGFSSIFTAPAEGSYLVSCSYEGSSTYKPSSDTETLFVTTAPIESWICFSFTPNPTSLGRTVTLKGILADNSSNPIGSADVTIQYSTDHGTTWYTALALTTNGYGIFSQAFTAPTRGIYLVRVSYAGSSTYRPCGCNTYLVVR